MEFTDLSLGARKHTSRSMKRKWDEEDIPQNDVDLQLQNPLPYYWEQCLDLQSGRMYYMNKRTSKKIWNRPEEHNINKLDLELNMSTGSNNNTNYNNMMVALACLNCHLLVILSKSSPSCPNCKYLHLHDLDSNRFLNP